MDDFLHDQAAGQIIQGGIRYLLIRPDVLMGIGAHTGGYGDFVKAMSESAFANAKGSFERYKATGRFDSEDALLETCAIAASLGWGAWSPQPLSERETLLLVGNSPFAHGAPPGPDPVCGPIVGVLKALYLTAYGDDVSVEETACAAQGHAHCQFRINRPPA